MGFLGPVATPSNFVLDLKITFDSANGADDSYYADVIIGVADNPFANTASGITGYVCRFHKNGTVAVYLKAFVTLPSLLASTAGSTISDGAEKNFRITVTSTTVKAAQVDGSGADITAATATNSSSRGGYITLGRAGLAAKFRDVSVNGGATGTLAKTNANDTVVASGTTTVTGSVAKTNANDTSSASGTVGSSVSGTVAYTNANDTASASGTTTVTGTLAVTNANDTLAASGTTTVVGSLSRTNASDTLAASGGVGFVGTLAVSNANDTALASGTTTVTGALAKTNTNDTIVASGISGSGPQPIDGPAGAGPRLRIVQSRRPAQLR
jgi:hypothetical protein